jgi:hypothetical protein
MALFNMGMGDDVVVTPDQPIPSTLGGRNEFPIYVLVPPTQLSHFLNTLNPSLYEKIDDLIFLSGGMTYGNIEDVLKEKGTCIRRSRSLLSWNFPDAYSNPPSLTTQVFSVQQDTVEIQ